MKRIDIEKIVYHDTYVMIESDSMFDSSYKRFIELNNSIRENKYESIQISGCYNNIKTEHSCLVWKPEIIDWQTFRQNMVSIGQKFNQESIIFSHQNNIQLIYTFGPNSGKIRTGVGFESKPSDNSDYSIIKLDDNTNFYIGKYYLKEEFYIPKNM